MNEVLKPETPIGKRVHERLVAFYGDNPPTVFRIVRRSHGLHFNSCGLVLNELTGHLNRHELEPDFKDTLFAIEALFSPATGEWEAV